MRTLIPLLLLLPTSACRKDDTGGPTDPEDTAFSIGDVRVGESCPRMELVKAINLALNDGTISLGNTIENAPQPYTGVPTLDNEHCTYHQYSPANCGTCTDPLVCNGEGNCVPWPSPFTDLVVTATAGDVSHEARGDPHYGWLYHQWPDEDEDWSLEVSFGQNRFTAPAMPIASGLEGVAVTVESSDEDAPGALDAIWIPLDDGSIVRSEIPINHHAQSGTFTLCEAGAEAGGFHAEAEMIDPLAVITGLEFQGLEHLHVAAADTSVGCVELRYGAHLRPDVTTP